LIGPREKNPMNAAIDVATPVIGRTPLGTSSIYTPGYVGVIGISTLSSGQRSETRTATHASSSRKNKVGVYCEAATVKRLLHQGFYCWASMQSLAETPTENYGEHVRTSTLNDATSSQVHTSTARR
jgi:hypothetical protein